MTRLGLRTRLALVFGAGFAVLLGLGALALSLHLARGYRREFDHNLQEAAQGAVALFQLDRPEYGTGWEAAAHVVSELVYGDRTLVAIDPADTTHQRRVASPRIPGEPWFSDAPRDAPKRRPITLQLREGEARVLRAPLAEGLEVVIAMSTLPLERWLDRLSRALITVLPVILLLGGLVGAWGSGLVLRPIVEVARAADQIGEAVVRGDTTFHPLPPSPAADEIATLTTAFNRLVARSTAAIAREREVAERQREFLAEVAHELRTPVAILRSEAEVALGEGNTAESRQEALAWIAAEAAEMGRLVNDLLLVARGDAGRLEPTRERLYLDDLVTTAVSRVRRLPLAAGRSITVGEFEAAPVLGDAALLEQALVVLLNNALVHAPGAAIEVSAGTATEGGQRRAWARVHDEGPGIPTEARERVFERFARLNPEAPGTGLGLPIARGVAEAHGGTVRLEPSARGATFALVLPEAEAAARA